MDNIEKIPFKINKLLIITGVLTPISTLVAFIVALTTALNYPIDRFAENITYAEIMALFFVVIVLVFSALVAFGSYFHATGSDMGKDLLFIGGIATIVLHIFWGIFLFFFKSSIVLLFFVPVILTFVAMIQTIASKHKNISLNLS